MLFGTLKNMPCGEKQRLLDVYQHVLEKHSAAVAELNGTMGTLSKPDYDALYRKTEAMREDVTIAQREFQVHVTEHGC